MAFQSQWYFSTLPEKLVDLIEREVGEDSSVPASSWVGGFVWHFLKRANRENFCYELSHLDGDSIKLKTYNEGDGQTWHVDAKPQEGDEDVRNRTKFYAQKGEDVIGFTPYVTTEFFANTDGNVDSNRSAFGLAKDLGDGYAIDAFYQKDKSFNGGSDSDAIGFGLNIAL